MKEDFFPNLHTGINSIATGYDLLALRCFQNHAKLTACKAFFCYSCRNTLLRICLHLNVFAADRKSDPGALCQFCPDTLRIDCCLASGCGYHKAGAFYFFHFSLQNIGISHKGCHIAGMRVVIDLIRSSCLFKPSLVHYRNGVGHIDSFLLVMGNIDKSNSKLYLKLLKFDLHGTP